MYWSVVWCSGGCSWKCYKTFTFCSLLTRSTIPCASEPPKVVRTWCVLYILTSKCASRHNGVHFFDISTSKSGPYMVCFVHFDLEMCFAPQRRALFRHLNFQKWSDHVVHFHFEMCFAPQRSALFRHLNFQKCSENGVFCTFWLANVLRATMACTFSTSQLPKVLRDRQILKLFTSKCASRHNAVHFFDISTSKSAPRPSVFNTFYFQMCFAPQRRALFRHLNFQNCSEPLRF